MGKYEDAVRCYLRTIELGPGAKDEEASLGSCYSLMEKREKDQAFAWLERAFRERDSYLLESLKHNHRFDPIRSDPRFTELLRKIGLDK